MRISNFNQYILCASCALLFVSPITRAEIYKWVVENGRTHYSENKVDAGKAKAIELNVGPQRTATQTTSSASSWQEKERQSRQRQVENVNENTYSPIAPARPESPSGGKSDHTAESKCNLARDVLNGAVRHANGAPTDEYDREVAENDIRAVCR